MTVLNGEPFVWAPLAPELNVQDIAVSVRFWRQLLGFQVLFERPEEGFAYLQLEGAQVMLEQLSAGSWSVGALERPFGRGINLQITLSSLAPMLERLADAGWPLYLAPAERWYRTGEHESGQRQFLVQDPDGYLLRFAEPLGERAITG